MDSIVRNPKFVYVSNFVFYLSVVLVLVSAIFASTGMEEEKKKPKPDPNVISNYERILALTIISFLFISIKLIQEMSRR